MFVYRLFCLSLIQLCLIYSCFMAMASVQVTAVFVAGDCDISMLSLRKQLSHMPSMWAPLSISALCPTSYGVFLLFGYYIWIELNSTFDCPKPVTNYLLYIFVVDKGHFVLLLSLSYFKTSIYVSTSI